MKKSSTILLLLAVFCQSCGQAKENFSWNLNTADKGNSSVTDAQSKKNKLAIEKMWDGYEKAHFSKTPGVTVVELKTWKGPYVLVDVREKREREISMIPSAITKEAFEKDIDRYRNSKVVNYCTIGYRSGEYTDDLRKAGINAFNLKGSILSWVHEGGSLIDPKGSPTKRVHVYGKTWNLLPSGFTPVW